MSLVRATDQLYKVKLYRLRSGPRRCSQGLGLAALLTRKRGHEGASHCGAMPQYPDELSIAEPKLGCHDNPSCWATRSGK